MTIIRDGGQVSESSYERLMVDRSSSIGTISLNRPEKRNALDRKMVEELYQAITELGQDANLKGIVLRGEGPVFCAGADLAYLQELYDFTLQENIEDSSALARALSAIWHSPIPVIARVHGHAIAGGCGLATVCDVVIASSNARFGYTEVRIGFVPAIVMAFLVRKVPQMQVRDLLLSGDVITAEKAFEKGLITELVSDVDELDKRIEEFCESLRKSDGEAIRLTRQMLGTIEGMELESALNYAARMNAIARTLPGCRAGIASFLAKDSD